MPSSYAYSLFLLFHVAGGDIIEKPIEPVSVYSENELIREVEKIISYLTPEIDWSVRIAAMQRVEGLFLGGLLLSPFTL